MRNINFSKYLALLCCALFSYCVLLKPDILPADYIAYNEIYNGTYAKIDDIEYSFRAIVGTFEFLGLDYLFFAMIISFLCLIIKVRVAQKTIPEASGLLFLFFYICFYAFLHELTQLRLAISTSFFYIAVYYRFIQQKNKFFVAYSLVALAFHLSVIFLFFPLIVNTKRRLFFFIAIIMLVWFGSSHYLMVLYDYMPNDKLKAYLISASRITPTSDSSLNILTLNNLLFCISLLAVSVSLRVLTFHHEEKKLILYCQFSNIIGFVFFYVFSAVPVIAFRVPELLRIIYPLVFALIVARAFKERRYSQLFLLLFLIIALAMCFITIRAISVNYT